MLLLQFGDISIQKMLVQKCLNSYIFISELLCISILAFTHKSKGGSRQAPEQKQFHLLIDIQSKMAEGKSVGYEKWAKKYNRKEAARTVCLLKEKGVDSYEDLVALTDKLTSRFSELSDSIKAAEKWMVEIGAL